MAGKTPARRLSSDPLGKRLVVGWQVSSSTIRPDQGGCAEVCYLVCDQATGLIFAPMAISALPAASACTFFSGWPGADPFS